MVSSTSPGHRIRREIGLVSGLIIRVVLRALLGSRLIIRVVFRLWIGSRLRAVPRLRTRAMARFSAR